MSDLIELDKLIELLEDHRTHHRKEAEQLLYYAMSQDDVERSIRHTSIANVLEKIAALITDEALFPRY